MTRRTDDLVDIYTRGLDPDHAATIRSFADFIGSPGWERKVLQLYARDVVSPYADLTEPAEHGNARLTPGDAWEAQNFYPMEGLGGYEWAQVRGSCPIPVVSLQRRTRKGRPFETWMVDDPTHLVGTKAAVRRVIDEAPYRTGRVLVAGLGMGLQLHAMAELMHETGRQRFREVTVVEIDPDVIALVEPRLRPLKSRGADGQQVPRVDFHTVNADFYEYLRTSATVRQGGFDAIYWDLAVGNPEQTHGDFARGCASCDKYAPGVPLFQFGLRPEGKPRKYAPGVAKIS
jgi:hypothetical protein